MCFISFGLHNNFTRLLQLFVAILEMMKPKVRYWNQQLKISHLVDGKGSIWTQTTNSEPEFFHQCVAILPDFSINFFKRCRVSCIFSHFQKCITHSLMYVLLRNKPNPFFLQFFNSETFFLYLYKQLNSKYFITTLINCFCKVLKLTKILFCYVGGNVHVLRMLNI